MSGINKIQFQVDISAVKCSLVISSENIHIHLYYVCMPLSVYVNQLNTFTLAARYRSCQARCPQKWRCVRHGRHVGDGGHVDWNDSSPVSQSAIRQGK